MSSSLRCAIYSRFSSDRQSPASITDQNRKCEQFAAARGWTVLAEHVYSDAAVRGTTSDRAGLTGLLAAAESRPRPFDAILVDDSSRLSRKLSDALLFSERLKFAGVRLVFVSQGFDSDSEQSDILMAVHGITDSQYIKELSKKTFRGLEGKVLAQLHHGGRCCGYRSVPIEDATRRDNYGRPMITGAQLRVDPEQAKIVRKIFTLYAGGLSIKATTKRLNAERVESPRPRVGREHSWAPSSVKNILENKRYIGLVSYGRTQKVRNPQTGKRIYRHKPESEWIKVASPDQRIVSDTLWNAVQARLQFVNETYGNHGGKGGLLRSRAASSRYIFSGLLKCGSCGGAITITSGRGRTHKSASYACPAREFRGTCSNTRRISSDALETQLLAKLQQDVLSPDALGYIFHRLEVELSKHFGAIDGNLENSRRRKARLEAELQNLCHVVAGGMDSPSLRLAITEREEEIKTLTAKTLGSGKQSVRTQIRDLNQRVAAELADLRVLLAARENTAAMRVQLAKHVKEIVLSPGDNDTIAYRGQWALLGDESRRECAEGQNRTGYAGLFRAALYR